MYGQLIVRRTTYPVKQFASWYKEKQLTLRPPFQRKDVWKPKAKSLLIDSVLRGLPLPIIILRDKAGISIEPHQEVVDGQQRLLSLLSYISPELFDSSARFTLSKTHIKELGGHSFEQLDADLQRRILDYELSVHVLPASVDDQQVLRIFARLNSTGLPLTAQELRNAEFQGAFKEFAYDLSLAHLDDWRQLRVFTEDNFARMRDVEFTSELVHRMLKGTTSTSKRTLDKLYRDFDDDFPDEEVAKQRFDGILSQILEGLTARARSTIFRQVTWFYTLFGDVHDRVYGTSRNGEAPYLRPTNAKDLPSLYWQKVVEFSAAIGAGTIGTADELKAITGRTTHLKTRRQRESWLRNVLPM